MCLARSGSARCERLASSFATTLSLKLPRTNGPIPIAREADTINGMADPTFQQLRVFLVVAEELHFGRAASRLHLAQPPVSRHIKALEAAVGAALFARTPAGVKLTPAGALLRHEAQTLLRRWHATTNRARDLDENVPHTLTLGAIESMALSALPTAVTSLRTRHPDIEWELSEDHTFELLNGFARGRLDAIIARGPIPSGGHHQVTVHDDELVVALPERHHLTGPYVNLTDLEEEDFVVYSRRTTTSGLGVVMVNACARAGFIPRIRREALGTELVLGLVAGGDGIAMVSEIIATTPHFGVRFVRLAGRPAVSTIMLAWQPEIPEPIMRELAGLLSTTAASETARRPAPS